MTFLLHYRQGTHAAGHGVALIVIAARHATPCSPHDDPAWPP